MQNNLYNTMYNPDVLSCIANLSNDEVFTPPEVANAMLDLLPQELFSDPNTTFLDPACKSGVFLREIAKRLLEGLKPIYPDLQERTDHIFKIICRAAVCTVPRRQTAIIPWCILIPWTATCGSKLSGTDGRMVSACSAEHRKRSTTVRRI